MLQELTKTEMSEITGGHKGKAYEAGRAMGEFVSKAGALFGFVAILFMPKS